MFENFSRWKHVLIGAIVVLVFLALNYSTIYRQKSRFHMENQDVFKYFNTEDGIDISWYHRANSIERLKQALDDDTIQMIEADVVFSKLNQNAEQPEPLMGHGTEDKFDLTVFHFIDTVIAQKRLKGIKLDFKMIEAVEPTLKYLNKIRNKILFPVWLNADAVLGPGGTEETVNGKRFIDLADEFCPSMTLSLGFSYLSPDPLKTPLTEKMVKEMYDLVKYTKQNVTFAINVAMFASSISPVRWLIKQDPERFSITLWTSMAGQNWQGADPVAICNVRKEFLKKQIFYDLSIHRDAWRQFLVLCGRLQNV